MLARGQRCSVNRCSHITSLSPAPPERSHSYYLPLLQASLRSLAASDMSFLRINSEGMLHLANKVVTDSSACGGRSGSWPVYLRS